MLGGFDSRFQVFSLGSPMKKAEKIIDHEFIATWHPRYDQTENDEQEYQGLIETVKLELLSMSGIKEGTFISILDWKAARVKGRVAWANINCYLRCFHDCLLTAMSNRLAMLVRLDGIGVPVGSTILHFMQPAQFPIMDVRTVEVLHRYNYITHKSRDLKRYPIFQQAIFSIQGAFPGWSLRQIDRAVFSFHKQNPELFPTKKKASERKCAP